MKPLLIFRDLALVYYSSHVEIDPKGFSTSDWHKLTIPIVKCKEEVIIVPYYLLHFFIGTG